MQGENLKIEYKNAAGEENHPMRSDDFPYVRIDSDIGRYPGGVVSWHWHQDVEIFYVEEGSLEYHINGHTFFFEKGSAGMVNSGVMHGITLGHGQRHAHVFMHIFDPRMLSGSRRVSEKYISPLFANAAIPFLMLKPQTDKDLIAVIRHSFAETAEDELKLQYSLMQIWKGFLDVSRNAEREEYGVCLADEKIKSMLMYIYDHYSDDISVKDIAEAAWTSERDAYRLFRKYMNTTPSAWLKGYRIRRACRLLRDTELPVTEVGLSCGFESGSYFTQAFRSQIHHSPSWYRKHWQDL